MNRRIFLAAMGSWTTALRAAAPTLDRFKLGAISDGFSEDFDEALQVMKGYGLGSAEARNATHYRVTALQQCRFVASRIPAFPHSRIPAL